MFITGSNKNYIRAKKLLDKKYRFESGLYLIEGEKLVNDAIRLGAEVETLFIDKKKEERFSRLSETIPTVYEMEERFISSLCETVTPQGIIAVCRRSVGEISEPRGRALILENLQDPGNVGAILRTAMGFGYNDVYLVGSADPFSMKSLRSGMTAQFVLRIVECSFDEAFGANGESLLVCADMNGENVRSIRNIPLKHTIVLGNEGNGVSVEAKKLCGKTVSIPMENGLESFNVAVSAGVLMYALGGICGE